jgi:hypothetical protein
MVQEHLDADRPPLPQHRGRRDLPGERDTAGLTAPGELGEQHDTVSQVDQLHWLHPEVSEGV